MKSTIENGLLAIWRNVGQCRKCIAKSFQFAVFFGFIAAAAALLGYSNAAWVSALAAIMGISLWITHIVVFALKDALYGRDHDVNDEHLSSFGFSRRGALPTFARSLALVAAGTALLPTLSKPALAACPSTTCHQQSDCGGGSCYCNSNRDCI